MSWKDMYNLYILRVIEVLDKYSNDPRYGSDIRKAIANLKSSMYPNN